MRYCKLIITIILIFIQNSNVVAQKDSVKQNDSLKRAMKKSETFIGVWPNLFLILPLSSGTGVASSLELGAKLSIGKRYKKVWYGTSIDYLHLFLKGYKDATVIRYSTFVEYHLYHSNKISPLIGIKPYLFHMIYKPENANFQFFNDDLNGKTTQHFIPSLYSYLGVDIPIKRKYNFLINLGYDTKFISTLGNIPGEKSRISLTFDFRVKL